MVSDFLHYNKQILGMYTTPNDIYHPIWYYQDTLTSYILTLNLKMQTKFGSLFFRKHKNKLENSYITYQLTSILASVWGKGGGSRPNKKSSQPLRMNDLWWDQRNVKMKMRKNTTAFIWIYCYNAKTQYIKMNTFLIQIESSNSILAKTHWYIIYDSTICPVNWTVSFTEKLLQYLKNTLAFKSITKELIGECVKQMQKMMHKLDCHNVLFTNITWIQTR